jgi:hypothetical protein
MILFFDVRSRNQIHVGRTLHNCLFGFDDFRRTAPTRRIFVEVDDGVGFLQFAHNRHLRQSRIQPLPDMRKAHRMKFEDGMSTVIWASPA